MVSTSPVPQLAGPPGALVPVSSIQFDDEGAVLAAPAKLSLHTVDQFGFPPPEEPEPPANTSNSQIE